MEVVLWLIGLWLVPAVVATGYHAEFERLIDQKKFLSKKKYRPGYHLSSPVGWLTNPAAFVLYKSVYHLFYQYHPYNGAWAPTHWGHAVSDNLVEWAHYPAALVPKDYYEKHGCLAGTAVEQNGYLTLFYTGHATSNNRTRETVNVAISADAIIFQKYLYNPVIRQPPFGVGDFRNPKVWRYRFWWYMMVGTATKDYRGTLVLYTSPDMFNWTYNRTLAVSYGDMGYMWESPDMVDVDGLDVFILSVQGVPADGYRFRNIYQTGYVVGKFNYRTLTLEDIEISTNTFTELDHGHDFYAAKTAIAPDGRRLLVAWLGMWDAEAPEAGDGWASMLTLVRELRLNRHGAVLMTPVREAARLRTELLEEAWYAPGEAFKAGSKSFEMILNSTTTMKDVSLVFEWADGDQFKIGYSAEHRQVSIDRAGADGVRRADWSPAARVNWRIFVDSSAVELYCGDGEVVFTSRIYPRGSILIRVGGETNVYITQYKLRRSVGYINDSLRKKLKSQYINSYKSNATKRN